jgi:hypothetical protein
MPPDGDDALLSVKRKASVCEGIQVICPPYRRLPKLPSLKTRAMRFRRASTNSELIRLVECCCSSPDSCFALYRLKSRLRSGTPGRRMPFSPPAGTNTAARPKGPAWSGAGRSSAMNPLLEDPRFTARRLCGRRPPLFHPPFLSCAGAETGTARIQLTSETKK